MKIKHNFEADIKPYEWIYIAATLVIAVLVFKGDMPMAIKVITEWIRSLK